MRVVVVLAHPPLPEGGAASRCSLALLRGLREHGADVRALAADIGPERPGSPPGDLGVEVMEVRHQPTLANRLWRVVAPFSTLSRGAFADRVRELAREADVVYLDEVVSAATARLTGVPTVCHLHFVARRDRDYGPPWSRDTRELLEIARAERRAVRRIGRLVANSEHVARDLRAAGARHVDVVPLGLDPAAYSPPAPLEASAAGLIGQGAWPPTALAIERLLSDVWPAVHRAVPEATLRLAGHGVAGAPSPGVDWVGTVPSATDFLRSLSVLLYPTPRGSGTKVKVLEALFLGIPVVTTPSGAEGIAPNDGVVVAESAGDLAAAAVELLGDPDARRARGAAARAYALAHHAPPVVAGRLLEVLAAARR